MYFFFFSSRRRHTRLQGDWSSDVCSSDLEHCSRQGAFLPDLAERKEDLVSFSTQDRKSTRLNSSHLVISYAVFCLKKKKLAVMLPFLVTQHLVLSQSRTASLRRRRLYSLN